MKSCALLKVDVVNAHHRTISRYPSGLVRINMHIAGVEKVMESSAVHDLIRSRIKVGLILFAESLPPAMM